MGIFSFISNQKRILHISPVDKFIPAFIVLTEQNFETKSHHFLLAGNENKYPIKSSPLIVYLNSNIQILTLLFEMYRAEKIILHSLFVREIVLLLAIQPWLLKKCYWVMWGGDLYQFIFRTKNIKSDIYEKIRTFVIKRLGHFITYIKGDYELAKQWYGASGNYHECLMYPSNLYKEYSIPPKNGTAINILVGNSADPTNNHFEAFDKLVKYKSKDMVIYCPLSYGDSDYAKEVAKKGNMLFGEKFIPMMDFIPFDQYLILLGKIDIAIFTHNRQQAMGNTITLLGLGKKVFMHNHVTPWQLFEDIGVVVFDFKELSIDLLSEDIKCRNIEKIKAYFSTESLINQLNTIYNSNHYF